MAIEEAEEPAWSKARIEEGIGGQMRPNPTHLRRPGRVNRRVKVESVTAQWPGRMGPRGGCSLYILQPIYFHRKKSEVYGLGEML